MHKNIKEKVIENWDDVANQVDSQENNLISAAPDDNQNYQTGEESFRLLNQSTLKESSTSTKLLIQVFGSLNNEQLKFMNK